MKSNTEIMSGFGVIADTNGWWAAFCSFVGRLSELESGHKGDIFTMETRKHLQTGTGSSSDHIQSLVTATQVVSEK